MVFGLKCHFTRRSFSGIILQEEKSPSLCLLHFSCCANNATEEPCCASSQTFISNPINVLLIISFTRVSANHRDDLP